MGAGEELGEHPGTGPNVGTNYIRQYAGKNISGATAGLAYNLGLAPADITNAGVHQADVNNADAAGNQNYNFNDVGNFAAGAGGLNLAKFIHYKLAGHDPVADGP